MVPPVVGYGSDHAGSHILAVRYAHLDSRAAFNASALLADDQQYDRQAIATGFATVSIGACLIALYWFLMMRRNFRHDLIILLVLGDLWKSVWYLVSGAVAVAGGNIDTLTTFCQASGYLLEVGLQSCDIAILLMSVHMSLQIFPFSNSKLKHDGLYTFRYWAYAFWIIVPNLTASLAFINEDPAYVYQAGFCSLPIRPVWYRLALSWIPRYLIWICVMGVAIRIYCHVGYEFKVFAKESDRSSGGSIPSDKINHEGITPLNRDNAGLAHPFGHVPENLFQPTPRQAESGISSIDYNSQGPTDMGVSLVTELASPRTQHPSTMAHDIPGSDGMSPKTGRHAINEQTLSPLPRQDNSLFVADPGLDPLAKQTSAISETAGEVATRIMQKRRRAIQKQLRLLFIYPVVYMILWVMPFVSHAMNYSNYYAQHPNFAVTVVSVICQCVMGVVDVYIFSWREKPWKHITGSDGTFFGSFLFWRFSSPQELLQAGVSDAAIPEEPKAQLTPSGSSRSSGHKQRFQMQWPFGTPASRTQISADVHDAETTSTQSANYQSELQPIVWNPPTNADTHSESETHLHPTTNKPRPTIPFSRNNTDTSRAQLNPSRDRKEWWERHNSIFDDLQDGSFSITGKEP